MNITAPKTLLALLLLAGCAANEAPTQVQPATPKVEIVPGSLEDFVTNVGDRIFFDFNEANVKPDGQAVLERQAAWLAKYSVKSVMVAGNCDERGTEEYNIALGARRAAVDARQLEARGISQDRIGTISYGKDRPVALGSDEASWAQNRNAITTLR